MLLLLLSLLITVHAGQLEDRLWFLEQAMVRAQTKVDEYGAIFDGAVILFHNTTSCPRGWEPASHLDGRFPLISHTDVGRVSERTTDHPPTTLRSDCQHAVGVRADGAIQTCRTMPVAFNAKEEVPSASFLACMKILI